MGQRMQFAPKGHPDAHRKITDFLTDFLEEFTVLLNDAQAKLSLLGECFESDAVGIAGQEMDKLYCKTMKALANMQKLLADMKGQGNG